MEALGFPKLTFGVTDVVRFRESLPILPAQLSLARSEVMDTKLYYQHQYQWDSVEIWVLHCHEYISIIVIIVIANTSTNNRRG